MAQTIELPGIGAKPETLELGPCEGNPYSPSNCVRVLACLGSEGLWFDGQAHGWDTGDVVGQLSTGQPCAGSWSSNGLFGTGFSSMECAGGLSARVLYHTLHNETGTVEGSGVDSQNRKVRVWTGLSVLEFLEKETGKPNALPCEDGSGGGTIPIG